MLSKVFGKGTLSLGTTATAAGGVKVGVACELLFTMLPKVDIMFA